jgi:hypothetical protein
MGKLLANSLVALYSQLYWHSQHSVQLFEGLLAEHEEPAVMFQVLEM